MVRNDPFISHEKAIWKGNNPRGLLKHGSYQPLTCPGMILQVGEKNEIERKMIAQSNCVDKKMACKFFVWVPVVLDYLGSSYEKDSYFGAQNPNNPNYLDVHGS